MTRQHNPVMLEELGHFDGIAECLITYDPFIFHSRHKPRYSYYLSYHWHPFPKIGTASSLKKSYLLKETY